MFHKIFAMHLQIDWILNILMVQAKNDEERSAICMAKGNMTLRMEPEPESAGGSSL